MDTNNTKANVYYIRQKFTRYTHKTLNLSNPIKLG